MDKDALVMQIGQTLVADDKVAAQPWDGYALIASYGDGTRRVSGFRYRDGEGAEAATPASAALGEQLDALRAATRVHDKDPWSVCVVRISRTTGKITVDFEYDNPGQWEITPATLQDVTERARPQ